MDFCFNPKSVTRTEGYVVKIVHHITVNFGYQSVNNDESDAFFLLKGGQNSGRIFKFVPHFKVTYHTVIDCSGLYQTGTRERENQGCGDSEG